LHAHGRARIDLIEAGPCDARRVGRAGDEVLENVVPALDRREIIRVGGRACLPRRTL
jgi:hypothetical protein